MNIINVTAETDGSAWAAVVNVQGVLYRATLVANQLSCSLVPYKHPPRRPRWHLQAVRDWAQKQVAQLPAEWMAKHRAMYAA